MRQPANDRRDRRAYEDAWNNEVKPGKRILEILTALLFGFIAVSFAYYFFNWLSG